MNLKKTSLVLLGAGAMILLGCSSSGGEPQRDAGSTGGSGGVGASGGAGGSSGGQAGTAGSGNGGGEAGAAGTFPDGDLTLPAGCAPDDVKVDCIPTTNKGCDESAGEACEYSEGTLFTCYPAPNTAGEGQDCNWETGPFCKATLTCFSEDPEDFAGICRKHCCTKEDCGSQNCEPFDPEFGTLGVCR